MATYSPHDAASRATADLLVGRAREQAALSAHLRSTLEGQGRLVLVSGEAGIGKTALVRWLIVEARQYGFQVLTGHSYDLTQTPPYGPWSEAFGKAHFVSDSPAARSILDER